MMEEPALFEPLPEPQPPLAGAGTPGSVPLEYDINFRPRSLTTPNVGPVEGTALAGPVVKADAFAYETSPLKLRFEFDRNVSLSLGPEDVTFEKVGGGAVPGEASGAMSPGQMGKPEALMRFSVDLTERARKGELVRIVGRDEEIRQLLEARNERRVRRGQAPIDVDEELLNRFLVLSVDEDRAQTRAIHDRQRHAQTLEGLLGSHERDRVVKLHQDAQRLLVPVMVVNPFAKELSFADARTRTRRDHLKYLTLIRAIALLHQHQRPRRTATHNGQVVGYMSVRTRPERAELSVALALVVLGAGLCPLGRHVALEVRTSMQQDGFGPDASFDVASRYYVPNYRFSNHTTNFHVPVGTRRGVGQAAHEFYRDSFIDELARAAGKDPYRYRRELIARTDFKFKADMLKALDMAAAKEMAPLAQHVAEKSTEQHHARLPPVSS